MSRIFSNCLVSLINCNALFMQHTDSDDPNAPGDGITIVIEDSTDVGDFVGEFPTVDSYLRNSLEELIHPAVLWILDHLDFAAVRRRFERDGCRYECIAGRVYRRTFPPVVAS